MADDKNMDLYAKPTFLQQTVGVDLTDMEKQRLLDELSRDLGHEMPPYATGRSRNRPQHLQRQRERPHSPTSCARPPPP